MNNVTDTGHNMQAGPEPCTAREAWEQWYLSPQGGYALMREKALLQRVLSSWPRRGHSLLNVQCGSGIFLEFFWEGGFDVTGVDRHLPFVTQAQERLNGKAEIHVATPDYLPFDDNEFDYVAVVHGLESTAIDEQILSEALRVAAKGVVLTLCNPWSLPYAARLCCRCSCSKLGAPWPFASHKSPLGYYTMLRTLSDNAQICVRSTLLGPQWTWGKRYAQVLNCLALPLPLGALVALRVDHRPLQTGTTLPLGLQNVRFKNLSPVRIMERRRKDAS